MYNRSVERKAERSVCALGYNWVHVGLATHDALEGDLVILAMNLKIVLRVTLSEHHVK